MTTLLTADRARARVNWGRWVADCPEQWCTNAEKLEPGQTSMHCTVCKVIVPVEWPADPDQIWAALTTRRHEATRNWYPAGYDEAVRLGLPHGQTPEQLIDETREHEGQD